MVQINSFYWKPRDALKKKKKKKKLTQHCKSTILQ